VDYLGIAPSLQEAVAHYTKEGIDEPTINQDEAVGVMIEKYELVKAMYHGFDYSLYITGKAKDKAEIAGGAMDHILASDDGKKENLSPSDTVSLTVSTDEYLKNILESDKKNILSVTMIKDISYTDEKQTHSVEIDSHPFSVAVS
jgi:type I restriction enzyme R subunit